METSGVLCSANDPVGKAVGNALEVMESIKCLKGEGPSDLEEMVVVEGALVLSSSHPLNDADGKKMTFEEGKAEISKVLKSGKALAKV